MANNEAVGMENEALDGLKQLGIQVEGLDPPSLRYAIHCLRVVVAVRGGPRPKR